MSIFRDIRPAQKVIAPQSSTHPRITQNKDSKNKKRKPENKKNKPDDDHKVDEFI